MRYFCMHHGNPTEATPDDQDIVMGPAVKFCPFCGTRLENEAKKDTI